MAAGVRVRESRRARRLRLTVTAEGPPELVVPVGTRAREIDAMLREHEDWISRKTEQLRRAAARRPRLGLARPGVVWLAGEPLPVRWRSGSRPLARLAGSALRVSGPRAQAGTAIDRWYRREARQRLEEMVAREAAELGVTPGPLSVRDQRTRWGSCSPTGALSFSWRLLLAPPEVADYVVVHELCHLRRLDHSSAFWAHVEAARPDWRASAGWLRRHGPELGSYDPAIALDGPPGRP